MLQKYWQGHKWWRSLLTNDRVYCKCRDGGTDMLMDGWMDKVSKRQTDRWLKLLIELLVSECVLRFATFLVTCYATQHPALLVCRSIWQSISWTVTLYFFCFCLLFLFLPHCTCPNDQVTSITGPAFPHVTWVAVYPALFGLDYHGACSNMLQLAAIKSFVLLINHLLHTT